MAVAVTGGGSDNDVVVVGGDDDGDERTILDYRPTVPRCLPNSSEAK